MSRENQAGLNGHTLAGEPAASVASAQQVLDVVIAAAGDGKGGVRTSTAIPTPAAEPAPPKPYGYVSIDRIENGFIVRAHTANFAEDLPTRVAYSPAEAGAAVAELLQRHMAAEDLKEAPGYAVLRFERSGFVATTWGHAAEAQEKLDRAEAAVRPKRIRAPAKPKAAKAEAKPKPDTVNPAAAAKPARKRNRAKS